MSEYVPNQEWDVIAVPAERNVPFYPCCPDEPYPDITFNITLRRKTLFYTMNIMVPCVCINLLTLTGFYVPCDCGEKISICITILLSLSMFQLLLLELLPGTSLTLPLLGKYIMFTMFVISGSIVSAVIVLNVNNKAVSVGEVPKVMKWFFLEMLAKVLCMPKPTEEEQDQEIEDQIDWSLAQSDLSSYSNPYKKRFRQRKSLIQEASKSLLDPDNTEFSDSSYGFYGGCDLLGARGFCEACTQKAMRSYPPNVQRALEGVGFIAKHHQDNDESAKVMC